MWKHPRPVRVVVPEAHVQFANTTGDLVNISCTGALIRTSYELPTDSVWPLVLELLLEPVPVIGRVVRCQSTEMVLPDSPRLRTQFALAVQFVELSARARRALQTVCGTDLEPGDPTRLFVVRRGRDSTFRSLQRQYGHDPAVRVIWDRRYAERRRANQPVPHERRHAQRRAVGPTAWPLTNHLVIELPRE